MSFIKTRKKLVSTAIASSLSVIATTAIAQDDATQLPTIQAQASAETQKSLKVDNSANSKFVAPLLDTPKSVSIISKQLIEDTKVTTLSDALRTVPGITLGAGEGGNPNGDRPFIRGYNSESSMYVDGIRNASSQNREMFAIEQVEVTKGSASAMGGAGTTGGSINMISKTAKKGDFLEGSVAGGTDNYQRITLDGNKDFGNGIAARVAVMGHHNDKAGQSDGTEYARAGIAPSITFGLDSDTRATLSYYYLKTDDTPDSGVPYNNPTGYSQYSGKPIDVKQGVYYGWKDRDFQKQENQIGTIKLEHDLADDLTLTNTAVYSQSKNDYLWTNPDDSKGNIYKTGTVWARVNSRVADTNTFTDQLALTGKFNTGFLKHSFNLGAEYSDQETDRTQYIIDGLSTTGTVNSSCSASAIASGWCTSVQNPNRGDWTGTISTDGADRYNTQTKSTSIYLLDSIEFNPQWLLDLGIRWDKFDTEQTMIAGRYNSTYSEGTITRAESDTDFINYQAGLTFKPVENGSIYASFATSANPVGIDAGDGSEAIGANYSNLDPEESRTFELGAKWDLFNDRLNLTAAIFRTEKQNTRIQIDSTTTANAGESQVDGFEVSLNGKITNKWEVSTGYSYLDSEITKAAYNAIAQEGKPLPFVAKNSATLWSTYRVMPKLTLGAGAEYRDQVFVNTTAPKYLPTYTIYNAMAKYDVNRNVNVQLNVNNISDKRYFTSAHAAHYAFEGNGRNAVLAINFKY